MIKGISRTRFSVIGHFAEGLPINDGQTVKTRSLAELLERYYQCGIQRVDTYDYRRHPVKLLKSTISCLFHSDCVFVLLSRNGRTILLPIISMLSKLSGSRVFHCLIGGKLADDVERRPWMAAVLNSLEANWVETHSLVARLKEVGVTNAAYLPNFKLLEPVDMKNRSYSSEPPFKLCTFSRVMREKGILDAIEAVESINRKAASCICLLDIYGQIEKSFSDEFARAIESAKYCSYSGNVESGRAVNILSGYDCMLFPTLWEGEGIPGTVIDALTAGLPVIAYKWAYYDEMLADGITGFGVSPGDRDQLSKAVVALFSEKDLLRNLGDQCLHKSRDYSPEKVFEIIDKAIQS